MHTKPRDSGGDLNPFREPPWEAPLDIERELESIPPSAQIRGMFLIPLVQETRRAHVGTMPKVRDRYVPFQFYPLREHARLLVETCIQVYPKLSLRQALRKLGRGAPSAFVASTLGRVVMHPNMSIFEITSGLARGYELSLKPGTAFVEQVNDNALDVTLIDIHYFIDTHHVGAFEGAMSFGGKKGRVRIQRVSAAQAVLRLEW
ncbi:MAG: DUF2378 family protein [Polyangiales bacterium]